MGRPRKEFDKEQFEKLCALQCTEVEIADWFEFSIDTLERRCKEIYKTTFADIVKKYKCYGKISLRRMQFKIAEKSAAMAIFLGKNYLGQRDDFHEDMNSELINQQIEITKDDATSDRFQRFLN